VARAAHQHPTQSFTQPMIGLRDDEAAVSDIVRVARLMSLWWSGDREILERLVEYLLFAEAVAWVLAEPIAGWPGVARAVLVELSPTMPSADLTPMERFHAAVEATARKLTADEHSTVAEFLAAVTERAAETTKRLRDG